MTDRFITCLVSILVKDKKKKKKKTIVFVRVIKLWCQNDVTKENIYTFIYKIRALLCLLLYSKKAFSLFVHA